MKRPWVACWCAVALLAGAAIGWSQRAAVATRDVYRLEAAHQLEIAGLSAASVKLVEDGDPLRSKRVLHRRLESAVERLHALPESAFQFPEEWAIPNLREGYRRAADYLADQDSPLSESANEVWQRLERRRQTS